MAEERKEWVYDPYSDTWERPDMRYWVERKGPEDYEVVWSCWVQSPPHMLYVHSDGRYKTLQEAKSIAVKWEASGSAWEYATKPKDFEPPARK